MSEPIAGAPPGDPATPGPGPDGQWVAGEQRRCIRGARFPQSSPLPSVRPGVCVIGLRFPLGVESRERTDVRKGPRVRGPRRRVGRAAGPVAWWRGSPGWAQLGPAGRAPGAGPAPLGLSEVTGSSLLIANRWALSVEGGLAGERGALASDDRDSGEPESRTSCAAQHSGHQPRVAPGPLKCGWSEPRCIIRVTHAPGFKGFQVT